MYKLLFLLFTLNVGYASICRNIDHSDRFKPSRDQDGHGYCWAFQAAALVEDYLCREQYICQEYVSVLDVSRGYWSLMNDYDEGGFGNKALKKVFSDGVCLEEYAPYVSFSDPHCEESGASLGGEVVCKNLKLINLFRRWKQAKDNSDFYDPYFINKISQSEQRRKIVNKFIQLLPNHGLENGRIERFLETTYLWNETGFLKKILITPQCQEKRLYLEKGLDLKMYPKPTEVIENIDTQKIISTVQTGLLRGRSVGVSIHIKEEPILKLPEWVKELKSVPQWLQDIFTEEDYYHSLVVTGMRVNPKTNNCEFKLRNSWGKRKLYNDWITEKDLEEISTRSYYIYTP